MRLLLPIAAFCIVVGLADAAGYGHGYGQFLMGWGAVVLGGTVMRRARWPAVLAVLCAIALGMTALCLVQVHHMPRARGIFASANFLAGYAVLSLFLAWLLLSHGRRWLLISAMAGCVVMIALSQSRGGAVALAAGLLTSLPRKWRGAALSACGALLLLFEAVRAPSDYTIVYRFQLWRLGLLVAKNHLLLGVGQGVLFNRFYSVPLDWLVTTGILGLGCWLWVVVGCVRAAWRLRDAQKPPMLGFIAAYLVGGLFIFDTPATLIPVGIAVAYLLSVVDRDVAKGAGLVDDRQPFMDLAVGAGHTGRADRGDRYGAIAREGIPRR